MSTLAIIGTGAVGTTIAYAAMRRGLARRMVLVDVKTEKARAEAMDPSHGAMFVLPVTIVEGTLDPCKARTSWS